MRSMILRSDLLLEMPALHLTTLIGNTMKKAIKLRT
jgi:hypothetical protein